MNNVQFESIKEIINNIEGQLQKPLDLEEIARQAGISKYHFHRLFKAVTGKSVMAYVRGRRLSASIWDLLNTELRIIDIARNYQFEHEQSYIRAFKQLFYLTPAQCRKRKQEIPIEQKIDVSQMCYIKPGLLVSPRMCIIPQFYVQGLREEIIHTENLRMKTTNRLMEEYRDVYLPTMKNVIDPTDYIGLVQYTDHERYSNYYMCCTPVSRLEVTKAPVLTETIPTCEYAVFRYVGFHSPYEISFALIKSLYDHIDVWMESTSYTQSHPFHYERVNLKICSDTYCEMEIYRPIMNG